MKKAIKVLTTTALLASLAAPFAAPVSAATENVSLTTPVLSTSTAVGTFASLGTVRVAETDSTIGSITGTVASPQQITITLPQGVEFKAAPTVATLGDFVTTNTAFAAADITLVPGSETTKGYTIQISGRTGAGAASKANLEFHFDNVADSQVKLDGVTGSVKVGIYAPNSGITSGDVVVGTAQSAGGTAVALNAPNISRAAAQTLGTIRVAENRAGAFDATNTINFVLPKGFTFTGATVGGVNVNPTMTAGLPYTIDIDSNGYSRLKVKPLAVNTGSTPAFFNVTPIISVDSDADLGDLKVDVKGDNAGVSATSVVAAKVAEFGVTASASGDVKTVYAGRQDQELTKLNIKEGIAGSLLSNRTIVLELPEWAHWQTLPTEDTGVKKGDATITNSGSTVDNDRRKVSLNVTAGGVLTDTTLKDLKVFLDANAPAGDLKVKVSGSQGLTGEYTLAQVKKPVAISADLKDLKIGVQNQATGDITIKEDAAGTLKAVVTELNNGWNKAGVVTNTNLDGNIVLSAPSGVKFAGVPTVAVTDGDLKLKSTGVKLNSDNNQLIIPIDTASKTASTIKLSNVKFTVDRTVPEGKLTLDATGNALDQTRDSNNVTRDAVVSADVANVVTPAPKDTTASNIVFKLNSKTFTVDGKEMTMDSAPLVAWDRAFLPVRFAANALNVSDDNIIWDDKTSTATIFKGDRVIVAKVGDKFLTVNGAKVPMDVPVYRSAATNNRVMIPVRYLGNALGAQINWNAETNEITVGTQK
ncbi:copper amine oxidase-like protein [Aneurinibacillus soli]|uniref:Copper amine oxidase-like N-terminal domain-containing protein n=1 Tax=Aneurinibacillus soli TaxID=1500254 RepID=A0A0U5B6R7_9BACL|nr:copper amine oxidase N-terminal domain-containing protein [Aneurinibacillus soli]PYE61520.1 copper amine oxidase-like protein [Aneurinibacillus soli]BAU26525.1 hypothetical protein CB4_00652 [Aneurinibacillus soli]